MAVAYIIGRPSPEFDSAALLIEAAFGGKLNPTTDRVRVVLRRRGLHDFDFLNRPSWHRGDVLSAIALGG